MSDPGPTLSRAPAQQRIRSVAIVGGAPDGMHDAQRISPLFGSNVYISSHAWGS